VRLLATRYAFQGIAEMARPTRTVLLAACVTDGLHAASMVAAAVTRPAYRRAALCSGCIATGSALATAFAASKAGGHV
jgi:hypothetical protein